jgi:hypothetical protein
VFGSTDARFGFDAATDARGAADVLAVKREITEAATALAALSTLVIPNIFGLFKARLEWSTVWVLAERLAGVSEIDSTERE